VRGEGFNQDEKCYACGTPFRRNGHGVIPFHPEALTSDGQRQFVGFDCMKKITAAGAAGFQPPAGGPRLFAEASAPAEVLQAAGITRIVRDAKTATD
jgi:hypothetical protein